MGPMSDDAPQPGRQEGPIDTEVAIVGAGMTGLSLALALDRAGVAAALIDAGPLSAAQPFAPTGRTTAVAAPAFRLWRRLGLDATMGGRAEPLRAIMIAEAGEPRLGAAARLTSSWRRLTPAREGGDEPFAHVVENHDAQNALIGLLAGARRLTVLSGETLAHFQDGADRATLTLESGASVRASLCAACDGRGSAVREAAGLRVTERPTGQWALCAVLAHERPHDGIARQVFFPEGPLALLPLAGRRGHHRSALVWSQPEARIRAAMALSDGALAAEIERRADGVLGGLAIEGPRSAYPLAVRLAETLTKGHTALLGDAARGMLPIAGQGFNLAARDVGCLVEAVLEAKHAGLEAGAPAVLARYQRERNLDGTASALATGAMNALFTAPIPGFGAVRRAGVGAAVSTEAARRFFAGLADHGAGELPDLLKPLGETAPAA